MTLKEFEIQLALGTVSLEDKREMASNPNTPVEILDKLSRDKTISVRSMVARNSNTSIEILERLSEDKDLYTSRRFLYK